MLRRYEYLFFADATFTHAEIYLGNSRDELYEPVLADSERGAVAELLQYLENVSAPFRPTT